MILNIQFILDPDTVNTLLNRLDNIDLIVESNKNHTLLFNAVDNGNFVEYTLNRILEFKSFVSFGQ